MRGPEKKSAGPEMELAGGRRALPGRLPVTVRLTKENIKEYFLFLQKKVYLCTPVKIKCL